MWCRAGLRWWILTLRILKNAERWRSCAKSGSETGHGNLTDRELEQLESGFHAAFVDACGHGDTMRAQDSLFHDAIVRGHTTSMWRNFSHTMILISSGSNTIISL